MFEIRNYVPRVFFPVGVAAAAATVPRRERDGMDSATTGELERSLAGLEARLQTREAADARFARVEIRLEGARRHIGGCPIYQPNRCSHGTITTQNHGISGGPPDHSGALHRSNQEHRITDRQPAVEGAGVARFAPDVHGSCGVCRGSVAQPLENVSFFGGTRVGVFPVRNQGSLICFCLKTYYSQEW